jgi:hypothetical protein
VEEVADEGVGFARGCAVTDGDGADVVLLDERGELACGLRGAAGVRVDDVVGEELAGFVDDGDFAAGAEAGVDAENGDGAGGRGEQKVVEVVAEDFDGGGIGPALEFEADFAL